VKIAKHYKPELVASKDEERFNLLDPYLDVEAERMVATDGHRLVAVPVEIEEGDVSGYVSRDLLKVGRRKAGKLEPSIQIINRIDLLPHEIEWPCLQGRTFPAWRGVLPPYHEGDEGTVTIGLNSKLLKGIADALGSEGLVALTVKLDSPSTSPLLVRAFLGQEDEIGILMPCRIDKASGKVAAPSPVMDLPPTEKQKKQAAKAAGEPDAIESMNLPGVSPGIPPHAVLEWESEQQGLFAAAVPTGRYEVREELDGWSARWVPHIGRGKTLATKTPTEGARLACAHHNVERLTDALLRSSGDGALTRADTKGDAVARKGRP
jgi:hypothetical protein